MLKNIISNLHRPFNTVLILALPILISMHSVGLFASVNNHNDADSVLNFLKQIYVKQPDKAVSVAKNYMISAIAITHEEKIRLSIYLGAAYFYLGQSDTSIIYLDSALYFSRNTENDQLLANSFNAEAIIHLHIANYDKALQMNKEAFQLYHKLNDTIAMVNSLKGIANVFLRMDQNDSAIHYNIEALSILKDRKDTTGLNYRAGLMMNIGNILNQHQLRGIISYYLKAEQLFLETENKQGLARLYHNMGSLYFDIDKFDSALIYLTNSAALKRKIDMQRNLSSTLLLQGDCNKALHNPEMAESYYKEAITTAEQMGDNYYLTLSIVSLAQIYINQNKTDSVKIYINALDRHNIDSPYLRSQIHKTKSNYYQHIKKYKEALKQYQLFKIYNDSVVNTKMARSTVELEKKYQTELKEKRNQQLKNQLLIKQHKEKQQRLYLIILITGVFILVVVIILLVKLLRTRSKSIRWLKQLQKAEQEKSRLEKLEHEQRIASEKTIRQLESEKHEQEIELSNRKLASLAMQIMNKNEVLREIETKLHTSTNEANLRQVNNLIKASYNFDKNWELLKKHFEKVHPGFFTGLKKKHTNLTDYDLRLAAYLKINLTTKEIAQIISVTPAAINKSRQRLRKKMQLSGESNFSDYFNNIS